MSASWAAAPAGSRGDPGAGPPGSFRQGLPEKPAPENPAIMRKFLVELFQKASENAAFPQKGDSRKLPFLSAGHPWAACWPTRPAGPALRLTQAPPSLPHAPECGRDTCTQGRKVGHEGIVQ